MAAGNLTVRNFLEVDALWPNGFTPVAGAHIKVADGSTTIWDRTAPSGIQSWILVTDRNAVRDEDPGLDAGRGRAIPDRRASVRDLDVGPGDRREAVRPERVDLEEVPDGEISCGHHRELRERTVHRNRFRVVVHIELVATDRRQRRVVSREVDLGRLVSDEVVSVRIGRLNRGATARSTFRHA